jgi:hypothetical protein
MLTMTSNTRDILKAFKGDLLVEAEIPYTDGRREKIDLASNVTFEQIVAKKRFAFSAPDGKSFITARKSELGEFLFVKNLCETEPSEISMPGVSKEYKLLDLSALTTANARDVFTLAPNGSAIFVKDASAAPAAETAEETDVTDCFAVADITKNYMVLDTAEIRKGDAGSFICNLPGRPGAVSVSAEVWVICLVGPGLFNSFRCRLLPFSICCSGGSHQDPCCKNCVHQFLYHFEIHVSETPFVFFSTPRAV